MKTRYEDPTADISMTDLSALPPWSGRKRGIPFTGPTVRATLDGRQTMTRRVWDRRLFAWWNVNRTLDDDGWPAACDEHGDWHRLQATYRVGDLLWIRETWSGEHWLRNVPPSKRLLVTRHDRLVPLIPETWYWADGSPAEGDWEKPRPSIHMPTWAARPERLVVTRVRAERVQDISEEDAIAEGMTPFGKAVATEDGVMHLTARQELALLWNTIYGPDAWDRNEWVWVYTYALLTADEAQEYRRMVMWDADSAS